MSQGRQSRDGVPLDTGNPLAELVAATMALDRAAKDFARETGFRAGLERALELAEGDPATTEALRAELRRSAWLPAPDGVPRDRREAYVLAAERLIRALDAAGLRETFAELAGDEVPGPADLPEGFRAFGAPVGTGEHTR